MIFYGVLLLDSFDVIAVALKEIVFVVVTMICRVLPLVALPCAVVSWMSSVLVYSDQLNCNRFQMSDSFDCAVMALWYA